MTLLFVADLGGYINPDGSGVGNWTKVRRPPEQAVGRIRAEVNAGRLGHAMVVMREFSFDDRTRIAGILERPARRHRMSAADAEDMNASAGAPNDQKRHRAARHNQGGSHQLSRDGKAWRK